ncbi:MAG: hypothetical protein Q8R28_11370 [Dehalococcoidia bacterium]|nr:hypothetical protein [Dehalococcoidia bacterium]
MPVPREEISLIVTPEVGHQLAHLIENSDFWACAGCDVLCEGELPGAAACTVCGRAYCDRECAETAHAAEQHQFQQEEE